MHIPIFIICRDRLSSLMLLIDWLGKSGQTDITLIDSNSVYSPIIDYLKKNKYPVIWSNENIGPYAPWTLGLTDKLESNYFLVCDPDVVPKEDCPLDAITHMKDILEREPFYSRPAIGIALEINDIPDCYKVKQTVLDWEQRFWKTKLAPDVYEANVDTAFVLYRKHSKPDPEALALRTDRPYVARHWTWYIDSNDPGREELFYQGRADPKIASWSSVKENRNVL